MIHFTRYVGNVKGEMDVKLGPKTLIVGPNGSRKSAIVQGIQLAAAGTADEIMGRNNVAIEEKLIRLAPAGESLNVVVYLSDESKATLSIKRKKDGTGKKVLSDVDFDRSKVFPFLKFRAAMLGSEESLQRHLVQYVTKGASEGEVLGRIPGEALRGLYKKLALNSPSQDSIETLLYVTQISKKKSNELKNKAEGAEQAALSASRGIALPDEASFDQAKSRVKIAQTQVDACVAWIASSSARETLKKAEEKLEALSREENELIEKVKGAEELSDEVKSALKTVLWHGRRKDCLICGPDAPCAASFSAFRSSRIDKAQGKLNARADIDAMIDRLNEVREEMAEADTEIGTAKSALGSRGAGTKPAVEIEVARGQLREVERKLRSLESDSITLSTAAKSRDEAVALQQEADKLKLLFDQCEQTISLILSVGIKRFEEKVQTFLPKSDQFKLDMSNGTYFGLVRDGNFCVPVSGSELVKISIAITMACKEQEVTAVIGEDVGWDPQHLGDAMRALKAADAQIFLQSTVKPAGATPGWTIVETEKDSDLPMELR